MQVPDRQPTKWRPFVVAVAVLLSATVIATAVWLLPPAAMGALGEDPWAAVHVHVGPESPGDYDLIIPLPDNATTALFDATTGVHVQERDGSTVLRILFDEANTYTARVEDHSGPSALWAWDAEDPPAATLLEGEGAVQFFIHVETQSRCELGHTTLHGVAHGGDAGDDGWSRAAASVAVC